MAQMEARLLEQMDHYASTLSARFDAVTSSISERVSKREVEMQSLKKERKDTTPGEEHSDGVEKMELEPHFDIGNQDATVVVEVEMNSLRKEPHKEISSDQYTELQNFISRRPQGTTYRHVGNIPITPKLVLQISSVTT